MTHPLVSVVIPTYERAHTLTRTLESVLRQTMGDLEVLVVDDGSTDATASMVRAIADARLRYLAQGENRGAPSARNLGIDQARGNFVAFLDSDDEWLPHKLECQLDTLDKTDLEGVGLIYCGFRSPQGVPSRPALRGRIFEDLFDFDGGFATSTFLVTRDVVESGVRFDEHLSAWQDWDFLVRVAAFFAVEVVDDVLVLQYRDRGGSHVFTRRNQLAAKRVLLDKYAAEWPRHPAAFAREQRRLAQLLLTEGEWLAAALHVARAAGMDPLGLLGAALRPHNLRTVGQALAGRMGDD